MAFYWISTYFLFHRFLPCWVHWREEQPMSVLIYFSCQPHCQPVVFCFIYCQLFRPCSEGRKHIIFQSACEMRRWDCSPFTWHESKGHEGQWDYSHEGKENYRHIEPYTGRVWMFRAELLWLGKQLIRVTVFSLSVWTGTSGGWAPRLSRGFPSSDDRCVSGTCGSISALGEMLLPPLGPHFPVPLACPCPVLLWPP